MFDPAEGRIPAAEAAARLGVKRETLYAYASRGMLQSRRALDGKSSTFDPAEVDALRRRRRRGRAGALDTVVSSGITRVSDDGLSLRGRDVAELVGMGFEAAADWVWGASPGTRWEQDPALAVALHRVRDVTPDGVPGLDRLRLAAAVASGTDPLRHDRQAASVARVGRRLLGGYVEVLPLRGRDRRGSVADRLWPRLTARRARLVAVAALDTALVVLADHDLASSTFAARIAASVRADPYSVAVAGLGALGGPLHGAASAGVHELLDRTRRSTSPVAAVGELLRREEALPGFGHTVYRHDDPRFGLLHRATTAAFAGDARLDLVESVIGVARGRTPEPANVDLALGALTWLAGMDADAGETVFAVSRTVGWLAHAVEEYAEEPLRFRPRSLPR